MANIEPFYISLGRKIQQIRDNKGISQSALGSRLEPRVTRASIANIEAGKQRVLAHTLVQLANALEIALTELVPEEVKINDTQVSQNDLAQKIETELLQQEVSPKLAKRLTKLVKQQGRKGK